MDFVTDKRNRIVVGGASAIGLIVALAAGISALTPAYQVRDSNGQNVWGVDFRGATSQSGVIASRTLANCNTIDGTSTGMLVCGTDTGGGGSVNTGAILDAGNDRWVNVSGDTMTGKLLVNLTSGTDALEVVQTTSGNILHAQAELHSSGSLVVEGTATINGAVTITEGALSDSSIVAGDIKDGEVGSAEIATDAVGTAELDDDANSPTAGSFVIVETGDASFDYLTPNAGTDVTADLEEETHATEHNEGGADALTVESLASSCTDIQVIGGNGAGGAECQTDADTTYAAGQGISLVNGNFRLNDSHSGTVIRASTTLASSGTLVFEGNASGRYLVVSKGFSGAGLVSCSNGTTSKLLWNSTTGRFSCGTDANTTYTAGKGLTLTSTAFSVNATLTGTMLRFLTVSGSLLKAKDTLASSGTLVWETAASGASLWVSTFEGAGLTDCDAATQTLAWDATGKRFSCGTDSDTTYTAGQGLTLTSTSFRLNASHSGTIIKAATTLASSGTLVWEGAGSGQELTLAGGNITFSRSGGIVFNSLKKNIDIRFAGSGSDNLFFLDGDDEEIGIGTNAPGARLEIRPGNADQQGLIVRGAPGGQNESLFYVRDGDTNDQFLRVDPGGIVIQNVNGLSTADYRVAGDWQEYLFFVDASEDKIGVGTSTPGSRFSISGSTVIGNALGSTAADAGVALEVIGTASGNALTISSLKNCDTIDTNANGVLACGTDDGAGGGISYATAEGIFVNQGGDTMTGQLIIDSVNALSASGLVVINDAGYAANDFRVEGDTNENLLFTDASADRVGILTNAPKAALDVIGTASGINLYAGDLLTIGKYPVYSNPFTLSFNEDATAPGTADQQAYHFTSGSASKNVLFCFAKTGTNTDCFGNDGTNFILTNEKTNGAFIWKEGLAFGGDLVTGGTEIMRLDSTTDLLELQGSFSGSRVHAKNTLASSGTIVAESTISGALIYAKPALREMSVQLFNTGSNVLVGSGAAMLEVPITMSGYNLYWVTASVSTAGTTNTTDVQISNRDKGNRKILTTNLTIDSGETSSRTAAAAAAVNASNDDVGGQDRLYIDIPARSTTPPKGMTVTLYFRKP